MTDTQRYRVDTDEIAAEVVGGEAVILNLSNGEYHSLDGAGGLAWASLARGNTLAEATAAVAGHYGVDEATAREDVARLVAALIADGLLSEAPDGEAAVSAVADDEMPPAGEYRAPELKSFRDMGDLLALDPPMPGLKEVPWQSPQE